MSSWASVTLVSLAALSSATASCAKCSCSRPTCATGPVNGPSIAIDAVHDFEPLELAAAWVELPLLALLLLLLLLLLLPQPAATSAVRAKAARLMRTFIGARTPPLWVLYNVRHAVMTGGVPGYAGVPSG